MNQQKPEIFETDSQDNANDIINKPQGQNQQQPYKMQSALNQVPNNQFAQMAPQFPGQINQFQFQPNFGISPGMAPGMLRMPPNGMNPPGMNPPGMNFQGMPPPGMPPPGMNPPGMNLPGMPPSGMNPPGMNLPGMNPPGMNPPGMNPPGMTPPGMPPNGMAPTGVNPIMFGYPQPQAQFHQGQFSLQMFQQNQAKNNDDEVQKQKQKEEIKKKNDEIQKLQNEVSQLKEEIEKLEYQFNKKSEEQEKESKLKFTNTKVKLNEDISSLKQQIYDQQRQIEQYEEKERQFVQIKKKHQNEISALMDEKIFLEQQLNSLDQSKAESSLQNKKQFEELQNLKSQVADYQKQIQKQDNQIQQQNQLMEILKQVKTQQSNDDSNSQNITKQLAEYKKKIEDLTQQNKQLENTYNHFLNEQKEYKANFEMIIIEKKMYMDRAQFFEQCTNELNAKLEQNLQRGQGDSKDDNKEYLKGFLQRQEEVKQKQQEQMMLAKERIQEQKIYDQQQQKTKNDLGKQKTKELVNKAGQIQCCFVMDLFKSTEKAGKAIIKATETCRTSIKEITNRESSWGAVCYGYTKSGLQITKQQFTQTSHQLTSFLQNQKLQQDQKDQPEDLKSALETMLNLDWTEKYKLAIIIPNSPCHGKKYHHPKKYSKFFGLWSVAYDSKPNDDMENIIKEIVKRNIFMLVIRFNEDTKVMCSQLEQLYSKIQHSGLFHTLSVKRLDQNNSDYELVMKIIQMASFIIGTKNIATKTKINEQMRMQNFDQGINDMKKLKEEVIVINKELQNEFQKQGENKKGDLPEVSVQDAIEDQRQFEEAAQRAQDCTDSALQALCKRGDVANFQTKVQCEDFNCIAYSVELKQSSFEKKIENIEQIKYGANDFDLKEQAQWQCIRTKKPFAYGMMKEVYLMKKKNNTKEIYVVKIPIQCGAYKKLEDAVNDCRSHLIAKNMMKVFIEKIRSKNDNIMMVQYTDFLILQENQNKYWIAERFFEGEFTKYNNNDGYICEDNSELNAISQAFSYFTYQMSTFNYIINDIQGVQNFFTDPAINTTKGNFDETDVGEDGMSSYLSTFQMRKGICEQLLKSIDIEID